MLRTSNLAVILLGTALLSAPAFSQEDRPKEKSEVSVQALGSFLKESNQNGIRQSATDSGGILANYRYFFSKYHGVEANYGHTLNTNSYGLTSGPLGVNAHSHEISGAYVFRYPTKRVTPFALAGVGALVFDPKDALAASTQTRAAFVYGAGADFNVTPRIYLRAQYRGLVYNSPTFDLAPLTDQDRVTHRAEPSVGVGFRF
jgi:opacity protein-like surface antigen